MDSEIAVLTAIALAVSLQIQAHPPKISLDEFSRAQAEAALCQPLEFGMPCINMDPADQDGGTLEAKSP